MEQKCNDTSSYIYIVTQTKSNNFPITENAMQTNLGGGQDGVFIKISSDMEKLITCTYVGGSATDAAFNVNVNKKTNEILISGNTLSNNIPGNKTDVLKSEVSGIDGFIIKLSNTTYEVIKSTYIGTEKNDFIYGIQSDKKGYIYIMGVTKGEWPIINSKYNSDGKQFIGKLNSDLSSWIYSTRFGTNSIEPNISPVAFMVDVCEQVYIGGFGKVNLSGKDKFGYTTEGTMGLPVTKNALMSTTDGGDFYFIVFEKDANSILYATFYGIQEYGETSGDHTDGGTSRFDPNGIIYQSICAHCGGEGRYPTTPGVVFPQKGTSKSCNMLGLKIDFQLSGIVSKIAYSYLNKQNPDTVCLNEPIEFYDTYKLAEKYYWNFGDGSKDIITTSPEYTYSFNKEGTYKVRLITVNSSACNVSDTSYINVTVINSVVDIDFSIERDEIDCNILKYKLTNLSKVKYKNSIYSNDDLLNSKFEINFGDGTVITTKDLVVYHTYKNPGLYNISISITELFCNKGEKKIKHLNAILKLKADFIIPPSICINFNFQIINISTEGTKYDWYLDDVFISNEKHPTLNLSVLKKFKLKLIIFDVTSCNKVDSIEKEFDIVERPVSNFEYELEKSSFNMMPKFVNTSINAQEYLWDFGDNSEPLKTTKKDTIIYHSYNQTQTYKACLTSINYLCTHKTCKNLNLVIYPSVIAPSAFSPNGDGLNDIFYFKISGAQEVHIKIYSRSGQVVYESYDKNGGWNGKFLDNDMQSDMYSYVVDIKGYDDKIKNFKGDFFLVR